MTSSSEGNLSSYSDDALDNLHRGPGMRCAYSRRYSSTCEESSDSRTETFDNRIYEAENAVDDECVEVTNRSDPKAEEDIICERAMLPPDGNQKYLLEQIKIQMQTQFDGLKDTLLKEIGEIKDTQRTLQQDLMRLKGSSSEYSWYTNQLFSGNSNTQFGIMGSKTRCRHCDHTPLTGAERIVGGDATAFYKDCRAYMIRMGHSEVSNRNNVSD